MKWIWHKYPFLIGSDEDVLKELKEIDITTLTPLDALNALYRLQNKLKNRWQSTAKSKETE